MSEPKYVTKYGNQATVPATPTYSFEHFPAWLQPTFARLKEQHDKNLEAELTKTK